MLKASFLRNIRFFSTTPSAASSSTPLTVKVIMWPPGKKVRQGKNVVRIDPLPTMLAKERRDNGEKGIEVYGHAAVEVHLDCSHQDMPLTLLPALQKLFALSLYPSAAANTQLMTGLRAYLSWFPESRPTNRVMTASQKREWLQALCTLYPNLRRFNREILESFMSREYDAVNSTFADDVFQYGTPSPDNVFTFSCGLDPQAIMDACFHLLYPSPILEKNGIVVLEEARPYSTYYGLSMLLEHQQLLNRGGVQQVMPTTVEHVCTTAALSLFKASLGQDEYFKIAREVVANNASLQHGFPIVEFMNKFISELSKRPEFMPATGHTNSLKNTK